MKDTAVQKERKQWEVSGTEEESGHFIQGASSSSQTSRHPIPLQTPLQNHPPERTLEETACIGDACAPREDTEARKLRGCHASREMSSTKRAFMDE